MSATALLDRLTYRCDIFVNGPSCRFKEWKQRQKGKGSKSAGKGVSGGKTTGR